MSTASQSRSVANPKYDRFVEEQLRRARQRIRLLDMTAAGLGLLIGTLAYALVMAILDRWFQLPGVVRQVAFGLYALSVTVYAALTMLRPLFYQVNPYFAARQVEQILPSAKNSVVSWLDLKDRPLPGAIHGAISHRAAKDLARADLDRAISARRASWLGGIVFGLFVGLLVLFFQGPPQFFSLMMRTFAPFTDSKLATRTEIAVTEPAGGSTTVAVGRAVDFVIRVDGRIPSSDAPDALKFLFRYQPAAPYEERARDTEDTGREWKLHFPATDVRNGFWYRVTGGDASTPEYHVAVRSTPLFTDFEVKYHFRPYLRRHDEVTHNPNIEAVRGTEISLIARMNRTVKEGHLDIGDDVTIPGQLMPSDPQALRFTFPLDKEGTYRIWFTSSEDEHNSEPMPYSIKVIPDTAPQVELVKPGQDITLPVNGALHLKGGATDDFGITGMALKVLVDARPQSWPYKPGHSLQQEDGTYPITVDYKARIPLEKVHQSNGKPLEPGMEIQYWLEAVDNCDYPRPQVGQSKHYKVTLAEPADGKGKLQTGKGQQQDGEGQEGQSDGDGKGQQKQDGDASGKEMNEGEKGKSEQQDTEKQADKDQHLQEQADRLNQAMGKDGPHQSGPEERQDANSKPDQDQKPSGDQNPSDGKNKDSTNPKQNASGKGEQHGNQSSSDDKASKDQGQSGEPGSKQDGNGAEGKDQSASPKQNHGARSGSSGDQGNRNADASHKDRQSTPGKQDSGNAGNQQGSQRSGQPDREAKHNEANGQNNRSQGSDQESPNKDGQGAQKHPAKPTGEQQGQQSGNEQSDQKSSQQKDSSAGGNGRRQKPNSGPSGTAKKGQEQQQDRSKSSSGEQNRHATGDRGTEKSAEQKSKQESSAGNPGSGQKQGDSANKSNDSQSAPGEKAAREGKDGTAQPDRQDGKGQEKNAGSSDSNAGNKQKAGDQKADGNQAAGNSQGKPERGSGDAAKEKPKGDRAGANPGHAKDRADKSQSGDDEQSRGNNDNKSRGGQESAAGDSRSGNGKSDQRELTGSGSQQDTNAEKKGRAGQGRGDQARTPDQLSQREADQLIKDLKSGDAKLQRDAARRLDDAKDNVRDPKLREAIREALGRSNDDAGQGTKETGSAHQQGEPIERAKESETAGDQQGDNGKRTTQNRPTDKPGQPSDAGALRGEASNPTRESTSMDRSQQPDGTSTGRGQQAGTVGQQSQAGESAAREGGMPGGGRRRGNPSAPPAEEEKTSAANSRFQQQAGEMQLEDWKKKVTPDVLKKANMTEQEYRDFLRAYEDMLRRQRNSDGPDRLTDPKAPGGSLKSRGVRRVNPGGEEKTDDLQHRGYYGPPPEFKDAYQEFTRKLSGLRQSKDDK